MKKKELIKHLQIQDIENKLVILQSEDILHTELRRLADDLQKRINMRNSSFLIIGPNDVAICCSMEDGRLISPPNFDKKKFVNTLNKVIENLKK